MNYINEVKFSGKIDRLKKVDTKTGTSMATLLLTVGRDSFKCVGFKNIADTLLSCKDGDHILVTGSGSINSWKDQDDRWHNDFQLTVWTVEVAGGTVVYDKGKSSSHKRADTRQPKPRVDEYAYQGGPF